MLRPIELLPPHSRGEEGAEDFARELDRACPEALELFDGTGGYAWEAPIPPEGERGVAARQFARALRKEVRKVKKILGERP